jgi:dTDP-4-amino-4,6-dideoxygalactose transaminase
MTSTSSTPPAYVGGLPAFPEGLPLTRPVLIDIPGLQERLGAILGSGQLTNGATVRELEETVAQRLGVADVVAVASCTAGLMLALQALGARGKVVMPSFTFSASAHAVVWAGGEPTFVDVAEDTLCVDPDAVRREIDGAAAMTATHIYGTPCRVEELQGIATEADIPLVYDAAHALGSSRAGTPIGGFGDAEVFSLSPTKVVVAGEGGLVSTRDPALAAEIRLGRNYGNPGDYNCRFAGLNARMSELHAAVALASLSLLDHNVARRNELVEQFWSAVRDVPGLRRPLVEPDDVSTYKDLTVVVDEADFGLSAPALAAVLEREGVESRRYYFPSIHAQDAYRHLSARSLPVTEAVSPAVLTVPLLPQMTDDQMTRLSDAVARIQEHAPAIRSSTGRS